MLKTTAVNSIAVAVAAGLVAALMVFAAFIVPEAKAESPVQAAIVQPVVTAACALQGWPYYKQGCQFDLRGSAGEKRTVRVVVVR